MRGYRFGNNTDRVGVSPLPDLHDQVRAYVPLPMAERGTASQVVCFDDTAEARETGEALIAAADALDAARARRRRTVTITGPTKALSTVINQARHVGCEVSS